MIDVGEATGEIEVELLASDSSTDTYTVTKRGQTQKATIWDDDAPEITIADAPPVTEAASANIDFPITARVSPNKPIDVYYTLTGTRASDFLASNEIGTGKSKSVNFSNNSTSGTLSIPIVNDEVDEEGVTVTVTLEAQPGNVADASYTIPATAPSATATIADDDDLPVLTIATAAAEEGETINFMPTLSAPAGKTVTITYSTEPSGDFPVEAGDYMSVTDTITIPAGKMTPVGNDGSTVQHIEITTIEDTTPEPDETFTLTYTAVNASTAEDAKAIGTVENDDGRVLAISSATVAEDAGSVDLNITLSPAPGTSESVVVSYSTTDGTATGSADGRGADFTSESSTTVTFSGTDDNIKPISIDISNDSLVELEESFTVVVSTTSSLVNTTYAGGIGTVSITDDEDQLVVNLVAVPTITEGTNASDNTDENITVNLGTGSDSAAHEIKVDYTITEVLNGADVPLDVLLASTAPGRASDAAGTLTFAAGTSTIDIPIEVIADNYDENEENFRIELSNPVNVSLGTRSITVNITDDDDEPTVSIAATKFENETNSNLNSGIAVTLSVASGKVVTVPFTVTPGTATPADYTFATSRELVFTPSETTTITALTQNIPYTIVGDGFTELEERFTVALDTANIVNADAAGQNTSGTVIIIDDDAPPELSISVLPADAEVTESSTAVAKFMISANKNPGSGFEYRYSVAQVGDFLTNSSVTASPQIETRAFTGRDNNYSLSLNLPIQDDRIGEPTGSITVTLLPTDGSVSDYTLGSDTSEEVTVFDDDAPELSIANAPSVTEGPNVRAEFPIMSSRDITGVLRVRYRADDGPGNFLAEGVDGTPQEAMLNFNGGKNAMLQVDIVEDQVVEEDGVIEVLLADDDANPINYALSRTARQASVTVIDNDTLASAPNVKIATEHLPTGATTVTYYIVADSAPAKDLEVVVEYDYGYTPSGGATTSYSPAERANVTIAAGATFGTFTEATTIRLPGVTATPPFVGTETATLRVTLVDGVNYNLGTPSTSGLPANQSTSTNPLVSISAAGDGNFVESSTARFVVTASPAPDTAFDVTVQVSQTGSFISTTDETITGGVVTKTVTIPTTGSDDFTIALHNDEDPEGATGVLTATVQSASGFVLGDYTQTATATIYDDDALPVLTIADPSPTSEGAGKVVYTVSSGFTTDTDLEVSYQVTEVLGNFLSTEAQLNLFKTETLEFRVDGSTNYVASIEVGLDDDNILEADGTITVTLLNDTTYPFGYKVGTPATGTASITDNDDDPELTIANASGNEGTGTNGSVNFMPVLDSPAKRDVTIRYSTVPSGDFPVDASDYTPANDAMIMILAGNQMPVKSDGSTPQPIEIITTEDGTGEPDETFTLNFSADFARTSGGTSAEGKILNDDGQVIAVTSTQVNEGDSRANLRITLSPAPGAGQSVVVQYSTTDGTATGST